MKLLAMGILAASASASVAAPEVSTTMVGRFQLVQGTYTVTTPETLFENKALFKLDTVTGQLFECYGYKHKNPVTGKETQGSKCVLFDRENALP